MRYDHLFLLINISSTITENIRAINERLISRGEKYRVFMVLKAVKSIIAKLTKVGNTLSILYYSKKSKCKQ